MPELQTLLPLDGDSWRHQLTFPDSAGLFDRSAAAAAMRELATRASSPPSSETPRPVTELREPILQAINAELVRAAASPHVQSAEQIAAAEPIDLKKVAAKGVVLRGAHHSEETAPSQDAAFVGSGGRCIVAALSDGSSSGIFSGIGAKILATRSVDLAGALLERKGEFLSPCSPEFLWALTSGMYTEIAGLCAAGKVSRDLASGHAFSATLHIVIVTPQSVTHLGLCDGFLRDGNTGAWRAARELAPRELILTASAEESKTPPFPAALFAYGPAYEALIAHRNTAVHPPDPASLVMLQGLAQLEESMCFRILSHTSSSSAFNSPIDISTDGLQYAERKYGKHPFPVDETLNRLTPAQARVAVALWNLSAERWDFPGDSSTFCATGCIREIILCDDAALKEELTRRLAKSPIGNWLPKRFLPTVSGIGEDLLLVVERAVKNESLRAVLARHAAPVGRALLDNYLAATGMPEIPQDGAPLRQLYDDLAIVRLALSRS